MNLEIYSASAGTGKTTKLAELLEQALLGGEGRRACRPEKILATTFTRQAAAELRERARVRLLAHGHHGAAQALDAALIGTVNGVCGRIISDFALTLGLSPDVRVLDEREAVAALEHCLSITCDVEEHQALALLGRSLPEINDRESHLYWPNGVRQIVELARANGLTPEGLRASGERSVASLLGLLGAPVKDAHAVDQRLIAALKGFVASVDRNEHKQKNTAEALDEAERALSTLTGGRPLLWSAWASLEKLNAGAKLRELVAPVQEAAALHDNHPALRDQLARAVAVIFDVAARTLQGYQEYKQHRGVVDFVDQEVLTLEALQRPDIASEMAHRLDLVLIDEFQDTSPLQLAIFLKLAHIAPRSVWVGDQKQAIYSFRGTDPSLMNVAIEELEGNGEMVDKAVDNLATQSKVHSLRKSWRSRAPLVHLTSKLFAPAFAAHDIPAERVEIEAGDPTDDPRLGTFLEYWALKLPDNRTTSTLPLPLAAGVQALLKDTKATVRDRLSGKVRRALCGDIGILCRTNAQCQGVADALAELGIASRVSRRGLFATEEGSAIKAALNLWRDPAAAASKAEISRLVGPNTDAQRWVDACVSQPRGAAFDAEPEIQALLKARRTGLTADVVTCFDRAIEAIQLRERCMQWGDATQRLANIDVARILVEAYAGDANDNGEAATLAGLLYHLEQLEEDDLDAWAMLEQGDAVSVTTWHAAKGLEWSVVVLFGLEPKRERPTQALGARAEAPETFTLSAPLAGRWIRYWTTPYRGANTKTNFYERLQQDPLAQNAKIQRAREELRLLYVGWTRARDRVVLACHDFKTHLVDGMLSRLQGPAGALIVMPGPKSCEVTWAGVTCPITVRELEAKDPIGTTRQATLDYAVAGRQQHPPARTRPSAAVGEASVDEVLEIGPACVVLGTPDRAALGHAMHAFFAADTHDLPQDVRQALAQDLLRAWEVEGSIEAPWLMNASTSLRAWANSLGKNIGWLTEVPVQQVLDTGSVVSGRIDLLVDTPDGYLIVDHKSQGRLHALNSGTTSAQAGQLWAYRDAVTKATGRNVKGCYIHRPLAGQLLRLGGGAPPR